MIRLRQSLSLSLCKWLSQIAGQCSAHPEPEPSPVIIILSIGELLSVRAPGPQTTLRVERRQNDSQTVAFTPNLPSRWENVSVWKCEVPTVPLYFSSEWLYYLLHQCRGNRGDEVQVLRGIHHLLHILRYRWVWINSIYLVWIRRDFLTQLPPFWTRVSFFEMPKKGFTSSLGLRTPPLWINSR